MVYNPKWLQIVIYVICISIFCLTIFMFYSAAVIIGEEDVTGAIPILFFGGVFGYAFYILSSLLKYIPAKLTYDEKGFVVELSGSTQNYSWSDISTTKTDGVCRVFQLVDHNNKAFYAVCFFTPGYKKFEHRVNHRTNLSD